MARFFLIEKLSHSEVDNEANVTPILHKNKLVSFIFSFFDKNESIGARGDIISYVFALLQPAAAVANLC